MIVIGIPTLYEEPELLQQCVNSIRSSQEHIVLIVDNSETKSAFLELELPSDNFYFSLPEKNLGVGGSWNRIMVEGLVGHPDTDAIFFLNDDIILHPGTLDNLYENLMEEFDAVSGYMVKRFLYDLPESIFSTGMHFSCFGLKRSTMDKIGEFDINYYPAYVEDTDYYYRMQRAGLKIGCNTRAPFIHRRHRNRKSPEIKEIHNRNRRYFQEKWGFHPREVAKQMMAGTR
jgi:GT2 family glycosyltransferase